MSKGPRPSGIVGFRMMRNMFVVFLLTGIAVGLCGCFDPQPLRGDTRGENFPLSKSEPDTRPAMHFDANKPFRLEFGRGSGWHGLDTIVLDEKGTVVLHRLQMEEKGTVIHHYWETTTLLLDPGMTRQIATLIQDLRILDMKRAYHADVHDGTQWVFWLVQGGQEKSVYFNNHFPKAIQDFAVTLDSHLRSAGVDKNKWIRVPDEESRQHEKAIWKGITDEPNTH